MLAWSGESEHEHGRASNWGWHPGGTTPDLRSPFKRGHAGCARRHDAVAIAEPCARRYPDLAAEHHPDPLRRPVVRVDLQDAVPAESNPPGGWLVSLRRRVHKQRDVLPEQGHDPDRAVVASSRHRANGGCPSI